MTMMNLPWLSIATVASAAMVGFVLLSPKVARDERWRATVTPLASIIGSGFLVLGPILLREFGQWAPVMMLALCAASYAFGAAIRANIRYLEPLISSGRVPPGTAWLELVSSWTLAVAYVISVTYYLNLLGSFAVSLSPANDRTSARLVTTAALCFIGLYGFRHGLARLEVLEQLAVTLKLAIIAGLLVALGYFALHLASDGAAVQNSLEMSGTSSLFIAFGLLITVQGFETSRYLGEEHNASMRIKTMKLSQWVSAAIYLVYVTALTWSFDASSIGQTETAIIGVTLQVAPVLPVMLVAAALAAQFSAGVADTVGCGGLVQELSRGKIRSQVGYLTVMVAGLVLTWTADIFQIIAYASRAFAIYYSLQSAVAAILAWKRRSPALTAAFVALAVLGSAIAIFGAAVEGS